MALAVIIALGATYWAIRSFTQNALSLRQEEITHKTLAEAKEALIAYAVSSSTFPGQLPCPENTSLVGTALEGSARSSCNSPVDRIGRLPWRTLGINKLTDATGEPIWYVLSDGFRSAPINSNTPAELSLNGVANSAVVILIAPGTPLNNQSRSAVTAANAPLASNYLDGENSDGDVMYETEAISSSFNDRVLSISHAELFQPIEKRVLNEVEANAAAYKDTWHTYPFAVPVSNPATLDEDNFIGLVNQSGGLLPVSDPSVTYNNALHSIRLVQGASTINGSCSSGASRIQCSATIPMFSIGSWTGTAELYFSNVGKGFIESNLTSSNFSTASSSTGINHIRPTANTAITSVSGVSLTKKIDSAANGIFTINFTVNQSFWNFSDTPIRLNLISTSYPDTTAPWVNPGTSWFMENEWYKLIYYRADDSYLPNGQLSPNSCSGDCLSINKISAYGITSVTIDVPAVIISAGAALNGQSHPAGSTIDYLDSSNNQMIDTAIVFDAQTLLDSNFNDQIKALEP